MPSSPPDPILAALAGLPRPEVDPETADRIRGNVLAVLARRNAAFDRGRERDSPERPERAAAWSWLRATWTGGLEPLLVGSAAAVYLVWAVGATLALLG